jgi:predicted permease
MKISSGWLKQYIFKKIKNASQKSQQTCLCLSPLFGIWVVVSINTTV